MLLINKLIKQPIITTLKITAWQVSCSEVNTRHTSNCRRVGCIHSPHSLTYSCKLLVIHSLAASLHLKLFGVYSGINKNKRLFIVQLPLFPLIIRPLLSGNYFDESKVNLWGGNECNFLFLIKLKSLQVMVYRDIIYAPQPYREEINYARLLQPGA